jgi:hypothetical protein
MAILPRAARRSRSEVPRSLPSLPRTHSLPPLLYGVHVQESKAESDIWRELGVRRLHVPRRSLVGLLVLVLSAAALALPAYAAPERSMSLSASKFGFSAEPGQQGSGEVFVINEGTQPLAVRVYVADQVIAPDGTITFVTPPVNANRATSPASWVTFKLPPDAKSTGNIPYIELAPGERAPVKFQVTVPQDATPGDRQAVLFFEMYEPQADVKGGTTRVNARLGARIQTRVNGEIVEKVEVGPFALPGFVLGSSVKYSFTVRNQGNIDERVNARFAVIDRSENERGISSVMTDTPLYASSVLVKKGTLELPGSPFGPTRVRLVVSYKGDSGVPKSIEKDRTVWAIPVWVPIAFGALILALILAGVWAAASRSAKRRMERAAARRSAEMPATQDEAGGSAVT